MCDRRKTYDVTVDCADLWGSADGIVTHGRQQAHDVWDLWSSMLCRYPGRMYHYHLWTLHVLTWLLPQRSFPMLSGFYCNVCFVKQPAHRQWCSAGSTWPVIHQLWMCVLSNKLPIGSDAQLAARDL